MVQATLSPARAAKTTAPPPLASEIDLGTLVAENALIDHAEDAFTQLRALFEAPGDDPAVAASGPVALHFYRHALEEAKHRDQPAQGAIHCCLISVSALMEVIHALVNHSHSPTPFQSARESKSLNELAKTAGRAAYRAGLLLTDPEQSPPCA